MIENKYSYKPTGFRPTFSTTVLIKCHIWVARAEANLAFRQSSFSPDIVLEKKNLSTFSKSLSFANHNLEDSEWVKIACCTSFIGYLRVLHSQVCHLKIIAHFKAGDMSFWCNISNGSKLSAAFKQQFCHRIVLAVLDTKDMYLIFNVCMWTCRGNGEIKYKK